MGLAALAAGALRVLIFLMVENFAPAPLVTVKSGLPSLSMSPIAMPRNPDPILEISYFGAKDMLPADVVFRRTDDEAPPILAVAKSGLPSPSISPIATLYGPEPAAKSTRLLKAIEFAEVIFLKTETLALLLLAVTISGLPSPFKSPIATPFGCEVPPVE